MRTGAVLLTVGVLSGLALWALSPRREEAPTADPTATASDPEPRPTLPHEPTTAKLVLRVRTADGSPLPAETRAGYARYGERRLRAAAGDGTFPFADAPVGRLEAVAEAPGYDAPSVTVVLIPGVAGEATITLTPR